MKRLWPALALCRIALAQSTTTTAAQSAADDGTTSSRTSAPSLLFSIPLIVLGLYFLTLARRLPRLTLPFALGNAFALAGWAAVVNLVSEDGVGGAQSASDWAEDMAVWGITAGSWVLGTVVGLLPKYGLLAGWTFLGCEGGLAVGFMLEMLADDLTIHSAGARWTIIGILTVAGLVSVVMTRNGGAIVACALSGGFLVMLGVDLLVNEDRGMATGLPKLIDRNGHHKQVRSFLPVESPGLTCEDRPLLHGTRRRRPPSLLLSAGS